MNINLIFWRNNFHFFHLIFHMSSIIFILILLMSLSLTMDLDKNLNINFLIIKKNHRKKLLSLYLCNHYLVLI